MNSSDNIFLSKPISASAIAVATSLENKSSGICDLSMLIDGHTIQMLLKERRTSKLLAMEVLPGSAENTINWNSLLENTSAKSKILRKYEFSKATVCICDTDFTLVPEALFKPGDEKKFYEKNFSVSEEKTILYQNIPSGHLVTIFGVNSTLERELQHLFQEPKIFHHSQAILSGINTFSKLENYKKLWLNIRNDQIDISVTENKKLILLNCFRWQTNEDILYYTLNVCEQLELNPEKINIIVSGMTDTDHPLFQLLYKYIRDVNFYTKPHTIQIEFKDQPAFHLNTLLYNLSLCE
jgi:hypothetical protein